MLPFGINELPHFQAEDPMKRFLLAARRTHTPTAYAALSAPILRELQERERDALAYLSQLPEASATVKR